MKRPLFHLIQDARPSSASTWLIRGVKAAAAIAVTALILRLVFFLLMKLYLDHSVDDLAKVTGMDIDIAAWVKSLVATVISFSLAPLLLRWFGGLTLPGFDPKVTLRLSIIVIGCSGILVILPPTIRTIRGLDRDGLPELLQTVDPKTSRWFTPDHQALIAVSFERDGSWEFWNRPGTTPQSAVEAIPVTTEIRETWETRQDNARQEKEREVRDAQQKSHKELEIREQERLRAVAVKEEVKRQERIQIEARTRFLKEEARAAQIKEERRLALEKENKKNEEQSETKERNSVPVLAALPVHETELIPWQIYTVQPDKWLEFWAFKANEIYVRLPKEAVIEVQGKGAYTYPIGVNKIALGTKGNFRIFSTQKEPLEIRILPAKTQSQ